MALFMGGERNMEGWNPFGWLLLSAGFILGMIVGGPQAEHSLWLIPYATMLAGITILSTNLIRTLWRSIRGRN